jgi:hypothetical protein
MRRVFDLYKPVIAGMEQLVSSCDSKDLAAIAGFFSRANASRDRLDDVKKGVHNRAHRISRD